MYKLLIVEDEANSREGLKHILSGIASLQVITAENGKEGYQTALQQKPDIIISDIRMPEWNGLTMIEKLHAKAFRGKIFLLTGYAEFEYAQKALHYNVSEYILKPVVPAQLISLIEKTLQTLQRNRRKEEIRNPQLCHLVTEEDVHFFENRLIPYHYTEYFAAVIYMESERHLPSEIKDALLKEKHLYILTLPDKHYRGVLVGFQNHAVKHSLIASISSMIERFPYLACVYDIRQAEAIGSWNQLFEMLQDCIPWTITFHSRFLSWHPSMDAAPEPYVEDSFLKKELQKLHCANAHDEYGALLLNVLHKMQRAQKHPAYIQMTALSSLVRLDSKQDYLAAVNQMAAAKTMHEITRNIQSYFSNSGNDANPNYSKLVKNCIAEIEKNYKTPITLNSTAEKFGITPQYLSRLFPKETSQSFIDYLTAYRMEKAKDLLRNTNMKINVICTEVGYPDAKYFCTLFKKVVGVTPNQYRDK